MKIEDIEKNEGLIKKCLKSKKLNHDEDAKQEAILAFIESYRKFNEGAGQKFSTFAYIKMCRALTEYKNNRNIVAIRRGSFRRHPEDAKKVSNATYFEIMDSDRIEKNMDDGSSFTDYLHSVSDKEKNILCMYLKESFKFKEIAEIKRTTYKDVISTYRSGIKKLRLMLTQESDHANGHS